MGQRNKRAGKTRDRQRRRASRAGPLVKVPAAGTDDARRSRHLGPGLPPKPAEEAAAGGTAAGLTAIDEQVAAGLKRSTDAGESGLDRRGGKARFVQRAGAELQRRG